MELKAGYKNSEIGVIPKDWEVTLFGELISNLCYGPRFSSRDYSPEGNVKTIRGTDVNQKGDIIYNQVPKASLPTNLVNEHKLVDGDLVMITTADCGLTGVYIDDGFPYIASAYAVRISLNSKGYPFIFKHIFQTRYAKDQIDLYIRKGTVANLPGSDILKFKFPLPPFEEQKAIAQVLSDTDNLIQALEQKLDKKRAIKQGAMQHLLTPKEDWEVKTILELADSKKQLFDDGDWIESEHITTSGVRLIQTGNIGVSKYVEKENKKFIYESSFEKLKCKQLQKGDLLICRLAEPAGRACVLPDLPYDKIVTSVDVTIFRPRPEIANRIFLMNIFSTSEWFKKVYESVGGTTHKRISRGSLGKISIQLPKIEEQNLTAVILSDMDLEIVQLEEKLGKYKQVKQGLMQELLTGKIRLV